MLTVPSRFLAYSCQLITSSSPSCSSNISANVFPLSEEEDEDSLCISPDGMS
jgi:hypothetical protein